MKDSKLKPTLLDAGKVYKQLFNNVHIGVLVVDENRHILEVNQTFCSLFGYAQPTEIVGQSVEMLHVSSGSSRRFGELVFDKVLQNEPISTRYEVKKKDGTSFWCRISGQPAQENQAVLWTFVDISEHVNHEHRLRAKREFSNSLITTAQVIILVLDAKGAIKQINPFMEELTGYKQNEVIGKDWFDTFLPEADHVEIRQDFQEAVGNIHISGQVNPIITKSGQELLIEWNNETLKGSNGHVLGVLCIGKDITARKQIEQVKDRLLQAADQSGEAIVITDPQGTIQYVNTSFIAITGYSFEEAIGQNPRVLRSGEHPVEFYHDMWKTLTSGNTWSGRFFNKKKDGSPYTEDATISPVKSPEGKLINYVAVKRDVTQKIVAESERLKLEEQLRQKNKMEAVGYMAGGMAHNFNNNLGIILGNVELSQLKVQDPMVKGLLKNAKTAIHHSRDLISQIITYSRKGIQNKAPMTLLSVVDETIALLNSTLPTTINLQKSFSPNCNSAFIHADASQIQEVLINLCNNAVEAMNEKGDLKISLEPVELSQKEISAQYDGTPGSYARLSVRDNGCGMPAEMLDKIFDPFFTTKEDYEGAGMGLATVQGIVAQHGGVIKVNSIPGQGTVFNLYFPRSGEKVSEEKPIDIDMLKGTEKILFVDDDEQLAILSEKFLSEMGYQVAFMTESTEALKLFTANPDHFDLVITDQTMPDLTGKELIQELKKIRVDLRTILCTDYSSKIDEGQAQQKGIDAFCMKPLNLPKLLQTVRRVLDGEKK